VKSNRALTHWNKSQISLENYQNYIARKPQQEKFKLTLIDLLYIRNFKGGNATVNEYEDDINGKLKEYSSVLQSIDKELYDTELVGFIEIDRIIELSTEFLKLGELSATAIDGFKSSFLSTLLHAYFPNSFPILDRRLLINMEIVDKKDADRQGQIKDISTFYPELIRRVHQICNLEKLSLRELDRRYFIKQLPDWSK